MKLYIALDGNFYTDWEFTNNKAFTTKKKLHNYMKKVNGFGCTCKKSKYHDDGTHFTNELKGYGYNIEIIEIDKEITL